MWHFYDMVVHWLMVTGIIIACVFLYAVGLTFWEIQNERYKKRKQDEVDAEEMKRFEELQLRAFSRAMAAEAAKGEALLNFEGRYPVPPKDRKKRTA